MVGIDSDRSLGWDRHDARWDRYIAEEIRPWQEQLPYVTEAHLYPPAGPEAPNGWLDVTVTEGRNHLVKRLLEAVGHPVVHLERTRFATLGIGDLRRGAHRLLTAAERKNLCALLPPAKG